MQEITKRLARWGLLFSVGASLFQFQGCALDPDIVLRAQLSAGTDFAIFLLENLTASF